MERRALAVDKRLTLAIILTILVVVVTQLLFPPVPPPRKEAARDTAADTVTDTVRVAPSETAGTAPGGDQVAGGGLPGAGTAAAGTAAAEAPAREPRTGGEGRTPGALFGREESPPPGDTVVVESPLYRLEFSTRGAALLGARLLRYQSFRKGDSEGQRVQLVRQGDRWLGYRVAVGGDTLDLRDRLLQASARRVRLDSLSGPDSLTFRFRLPDTSFRFAVTYRFEPDSYAVGIRGRVEGLRGRGYTVLTQLGRGLRSNAANRSEDEKSTQYVVNSQAGDIRSRKLSKVSRDSLHVAEGAPFQWVAVRNTYFLYALLRTPEGPGFGGLLALGLEDENAAELTASFPVPAGEPGFELTGYMGPQELGRLAAFGQDLEGVNPYGYQWMQIIIRPLAGLVTTALTWLHTNLSLAYGWVLMLFGVLMRVVLFPLYQKSMRAQMAQMQVQPLMKELQDKYEDEPQKLQQEMVKLYKEHNINPLAGCLPMLLPWPILITLFFVFKNTIEFRGVPFLWLPDLSLKDPYYIIPVLMGVSMFLLQWIGQRGMERNTQMKLMSYGFPVIFTVIFLQFPAGLNLYYATSNLASLPQQLYLAKERREMQQKKGISTGD